MNFTHLKNKFNTISDLIDSNNKMRTPPQNKNTEAKKNKLKKYLNQKRKIKNKIKSLLENEDDYFNEHKDINNSSSSISLQEKYELSNLENISPNINFEYSFSPNLIIKKITSNKSRDENKNNSDIYCLSNFLIPDRNKDNFRLFNKIFKSDNKKLNEEKGENIEKELFIHDKIEINEDFKYFSCQNYKKKSQVKIIINEDKIEEKEKKEIFSITKIQSNVLDNLKETTSENNLNNTENKISNVNEIFKIENYTDLLNNDNRNSVKQIFKSNLLKYRNNYNNYVLNNTGENNISINKIYSDSHSIQTRIGMKYKMFNIIEKKFCLDLITEEGYNIKLVSELCEVPLKNLKRWMVVGSERKRGGGRKVKDPELDNKILKWYEELNKRGRIPTPKEFRKKALTLSQGKDFLASKGWLEKFKKKYNLVLSTRASKTNKEK